MGEVLVELHRKSIQFKNYCGFNKGEEEKVLFQKWIGKFQNR